MVPQRAHASNPLCGFEHLQLQDPNCLHTFRPCNLSHSHLQLQPLAASAFASPDDPDLKPPAGVFGEPPPPLSLRRPDQSVAMEVLGKPLQLPCGLRMPNRLCKTATSEHMGHVKTGEAHRPLKPLKLVLDLKPVWQDHFIDKHRPVWTASDQSTQEVVA